MSFEKETWHDSSSFKPKWFSSNSFGNSLNVWKNMPMKKVLFDLQCMKSISLFELMLSSWPRRGITSSFIWVYLQLNILVTKYHQWKSLEDPFDKTCKYCIVVLSEIPNSTKKIRFYKSKLLKNADLPSFIKTP